ncbi:urea transporter [Actinobacillus pleuropneumoniae]|uniref:Urea transport protein ApUT n=1 Tax=Actinobacillus pleuropneumoniae serotype 7 (strain AP76) TaxID=537457 RepID=B3H2L6_ACTP7|nr:urea transporter [Actinobacillus pleuropneumoniae]ACE62333.1 urea transport protein ApUT [Actinobacillus pleuropneumoniae serovar 7 str. AP76]EFN02124.1 Urea transport protein [Actinobacillus pleuropneumoniae serovar 13 str. N273]UKH39740.1 urea transporter [Actinobacillus pleuropneumoniae]UQZ25314.1 urea transporter [Actinobacillus pleuropneumoniae]
MKLLKSTLTGVRQIFLQENGLSGLVIVIAMFFSHWTLGVGCFLGALIGTYTASLLKYPQRQIEQGLYGFNASLAFMCVMFTFGLVDASNPMIWLNAVSASIVATLIMREFTKWNKIAFTFPFVFTCWIFCWAIAKYHFFDLSQTTPALADNTNTLQAIGEPFYAWAEVNFGSSMITGILLFLAISINSPMAAMYGLAAATIGTSFANQLLTVQPNQLANGIYGFSPILVACAFAGDRFRNFVYIILGSLLAVLIQFSISSLGIPSYTIGFIIASWLLLAVKSKLDKAAFDKNKLVRLLNP